MAKPNPGSQGPDGPRNQPGNNKRMALPIRLEHHPVVLEEQARRAADFQLRIADKITAFAGSMNFVYLHIALFTVWMLFIESKPWPTLTLMRVAIPFAREQARRSEPTVKCPRRQPRPAKVPSTDGAGRQARSGAPAAGHRPAGG
jgi:hypothetical protein